MENEILDDDFVGETFGNVEYGGFWQRFGASLIDALVFLPLIGLMFYNMIYWKSLEVAILITFLMLAYKPLMEYYYGATLGKMALKLQIVTQDFQEISINQAFSRYIPWLISGAVNLVVTFFLFNYEPFLDATTYMDMSLAQQQAPHTMLGSLFGMLPTLSALIMLGSDERVSGHDMLAKTYCIKKRQ